MKVYKSLTNILNQDEDLEKFIKKFNTIFIKPNFCAISKPPATTPFDTIAKMGEYCSSLKKDVIVIETDIVDMSAETRADKLGFSKIKLPFMNVTHNNDNAKTSSIQITSKKKIRMFTGEKDEGIINLPLIKAHSFAKITCATKNLFGLACVSDKWKYHKYLRLILTEINRIYREKVFTIVDGRLGMEGHGSPIKGDLIKFNPEFWIIGRNLLEIDSIVETTFFPKFRFYRSLYAHPVYLDDIPNIKLITCNRELRSSESSLTERIFNWGLERAPLDYPLFKTLLFFKPLLLWRKKK